MINRRGLSTPRWAFLLLAAAVLTTFSGCLANALATVMYVVNPNDQSADYAGLKDKRVVVVCRPPSDIQFSNANVADNLARSVGVLLQRNVKHIKVIDAQKVKEWTDENTWREFSEIGKALDAEMVVGIDLERFSLQRHPTLFQGEALVHLRVYSLEDGEATLEYEKDPPPVVYPPNTGIPSHEREESQFRREYTAALADEIAKHFFAHDSRSQFARDTAALH